MARFLLVSTHDECRLPKDIGWPDETEIEIVKIENAGRILEEQNFDGVFFPADLDQRRGLGLFESESVLDQLPDGVALLDSEGTIFRANQRLLQWFGESSIGRNIYEVMGNPKFISRKNVPSKPAHEGRSRQRHCFIRATDIFD